MLAASSSGILRSPVLWHPPRRHSFSLLLGSHELTLLDSVAPKGCGGNSGKEPSGQASRSSSLCCCLTLGWGLAGCGLRLALQVG